MLLLFLGYKDFIKPLTSKNTWILWTRVLQVTQLFTLSIFFTFLDSISQSHTSKLSKTLQHPISQDINYKRTVIPLLSGHFYSTGKS